MKRIRGDAVVGAVTAAAAVVAPVVASAPAAADEQYTPAGWNGVNKVYLSKACHNNTGSTCNDNYYCGWSENDGSYKNSWWATFIADGFLDRGYKVTIGNGTLQQNIANSNGWAPMVHIPMHSNGYSPHDCGSTAYANHGFQGLYRYSNQQSCVDWISYFMGFATPGTDDKLVQRTDLGELNSVNATSCYVEAEFHVWNIGVNFLDDFGVWQWRIPAAVDAYLGYP